MKKRILLLLAAALLLCGCGPVPAAPPPTPAPATVQLFAMDTVMDLTVYGGDSLLDELTGRIRTLEHALSVTDEGSEIARLNRGETVTLSQDTLALLQGGLALCEATGGALDLSIYPVLQAWGFTTGNYTVPSQELLAELLQSVDYRRITPGEDGTLTLPEGMEIDLGSVAKGYTAELLAGELKAAGVTSALLNLGGNVQAVGRKPDGSPWRIAIRDPFSDEDYLGILQVEEEAVVTSGGYERFFEQDGRIYWHILDPSTGAPAESGLVSVTVVSPGGLQCDGLSTALFVMGLDRALDYWRADGSFEAVFVTDTGEVWVTNGLADRFSLVRESELHFVS